MARTEYVGSIPFTTIVPLLRAWTEKTAEGTDVRKLEMIASSTRVDTYRDRMSGNALAEMAAQATGKDFLPSHRAEWDEALGTVTDGKVTDTIFSATAVLDPSGKTAQERADTLYALVAKGKTIGVSIAGFVKRVMFEEDAQGREVRVIDSLQLDHIAATRSPANPDAFIVGLSKSLDEVPSLGTLNIVERSIVPFAKHPVAPEVMPWSFSAADGNALTDKGGWGLYQAAHTWWNPDAPEVKASYKLPHHKLIGGTLTTVWRGVAAAMVVLLGGRGGVQIPASERKGVYNHLLKHYQEFQKPVPDFKSVEAWWALCESASEVTLGDARYYYQFEQLFRADELVCLAQTDEEEFPMEKAEVQSLLADAQTATTTALTDAVNKTLADSLKPLSDGLMTLSEMVKTLAVSQGQLVTDVKQAHEAVAMIKETVETKISRGAKGKVSFKTDLPDESIDNEDELGVGKASPFDEIAKDHGFPSWEQMKMKDPHKALRALTDVTSLPGPRGRMAGTLFDVLRNEGDGSPHGDTRAGWQAKKE